MPDPKKKVVDNASSAEKARASRILELSKQWGVPTASIYSQSNRNRDANQVAGAENYQSYWTFDNQGNVAQSTRDYGQPIGVSPYTPADIALQQQYPGQGMTVAKLAAIQAAQQTTSAPGSIAATQLNKSGMSKVTPLKKGGKMKRPKYDNGGNILEFAHIFNYGGKMVYCDVPMLAGIKDLEMTPSNMIAESGIHIKPQNRGKFTAAAERAGMGVQEYANKIMRNPGNYSPTLVKRANFARNANKWHKAEYGVDIPSFMGLKALDNIKTLEMAPPGSIPRAQNGFGGPGPNPWEQYMPQQPPQYMMDPMQNQRQPVTSALPPGAGQPIDLSQATDQLGYAPNEGPQWNMPEEPQGGIAGAATAIGDTMPNIHINAGAAITGLAGLVTKAAKKSQAVDEFSRLKRRNLTMQTYNPNAYGTGSQAIGMQGIKVGGKEYQLTPAQSKFLKKQGYKL